MFRQRKIEPEVLDHLPPEAARPNLADLVRINQHLGGHRVLREVLAAAAPEGNATFLDVGAASGDTARLVRQLYPTARVVSLDYNATNLEAAPQPKLLGDAFELPFRARSFDYVVCSLFLHHFEDNRVVDLLAAFYALARRGILVCDLERHVLPYVFLSATRRVYGWNKVTVEDGLKSVRAAFRPHELKLLAERAGIRISVIRSYRPAFRLGLVGLR